MNSDTDAGAHVYVYEQMHMHQCPLGVIHVQCSIRMVRGVYTGCLHNNAC